MNCKFCNREINNQGSLIAHQNTCKSNPDRTPQIHSPHAGAQKGCTPWNKGTKTGSHERWRRLFPNEQIFVEHSTYARTCLKNRILTDDLIEYMCACCGIGPIWNGKTMPLILDHINGIKDDNTLTNLRFVCSNCDSQLPTYKSKNRKNLEE